MTSRVKPDIRAYETVVANGAWSFVENREIEVGKDAFAPSDIATINAVKRLIDDDALSCFA